MSRIEKLRETKVEVPLSSWNLRNPKRRLRGLENNSKHIGFV